MIEVPERGRVFARPMRPGLGDCAPSGRIRLDALARWLQDIAYGDVEDVGLENAAVWVVRRMRMHVERFPRFGEHLVVRTFCSGIGRMWAERRTSIVRQGEAQADVEAVALWVHLDPVARRPSPLTSAEMEVYGGTGADRRVTARLRHPAPDGAKPSGGWRFRAADCDLADHVNNAAYWALLEEELIGGPDPVRMDVEIEFRTPAQPGDKQILADGTRRWITDGSGETHASFLLSQLEVD